MGKKDSSISRKKLIKRIAKKVGITKKQAKKALNIILKEGNSFKKQKLKVVKVKKEVPVEVIKEVTIVREIGDAKKVSKKKIKKSNKNKNKKKTQPKNKLRVANKTLIKKTKDVSVKSKEKEPLIIESKKKAEKTTKPKAVRKPTLIKTQSPKAEAEVEEFELKPSPSKIKRNTVSTKVDDLTKIEGIGPAIARILKSNGISTFRNLADCRVVYLRTILDRAGSRFKMHHPDTWPQQSALAAEGKWDELSKLQETLKRGR